VLVLDADGSLEAEKITLYRFVRELSGSVE
jgi:hypothetical protein